MGSIGGLIGIGDSPGAQGLGFSGQSANIASPTTVQQAQDAYATSQGGISEQQAFLNALKAQGGIQNQADVYNQLQGVANGTGPNPAQAMLANATGQNAAQTAALMAGQRGAGQNVGLIARQAGMAGMNAQQNSAGQAAVLQANQSLGALNQLGGIAGQQVANQGAATGALSSAQQNEQGLILNAIQGQNNASVQNQANLNNVNSNMAQAGAKAQQGTYSAIGAAIPGLAGSMIPMASGGVVPKRMADGGDVSADLGADLNAPGQSHLGAVLGSSSFVPGVQVAPTSVTAPGTPNPLADGGGKDEGGGSPMDMIGKLLPLALMALNKGGNVPAMLSPGEIYLPPRDAEKVAKGKESPMAGKRVPGKAPVKGDSLKNDTVPAKLEEGGIVIPRSHAMDEDKAAAFVAAHFKKKGLSRGR